jgi:uncharacterized protein
MTQQSPAKSKLFRVIVDSNALFVPLNFGIDIFEELRRLLNAKFELVLISPVKRELEILAKKPSPKTQHEAAFALSLTKKLCYIKIIQKPNEQTDDTILRAAKQWNAAVFTNDKVLKRKLRDISLPVIYVRAKSHLEIDGLIP